MPVTVIGRDLPVFISPRGSGSGSHIITEGSFWCAVVQGPPVLFVMKRSSVQWTYSAYRRKKIVIMLDTDAGEHRLIRTL